MTYNINDGWNISQTAATIRDLAPDIVLLNEVRCHWEHWEAGPTRQQARYIAGSSFDLPYVAYEDTVAVGGAGTKGVAILSRYPIVSTSMHMVMHDGESTTSGTLQATVRIGSVDHKVFSTRFTAHDGAHNLAGHQQATELMVNTPTTVPVIIGGDFNGGEGHEAFREYSGLTDTYLARPDPLACQDCDRLDILYIRSRYSVTATAWRRGYEGASDHPYMLAELSPNGGAHPGIFVPNVVGESVGDAWHTLRSAGFMVDQRSVVDKTCESIDIVVHQNPKTDVVLLPGDHCTNLRWCCALRLRLVVPRGSSSVYFGAIRWC